MIGRLYLFKSKRDWRKGGEPIAKTFQSILEKCESDISATRPNKDDVYNAYIDCINSLNRVSDIYCDYIVRRDGIVALKNLTFTNNELEQSSSDFAAKQSRNFAKEVSDRFYFFLRDLSHSHQHHNPSTDTILTLHKSKNNEIYWAGNIIYSLYFHTIRLKRKRDDKYHLDSLGILAYIKSFKKILDNRLVELNISPSESKIPIFNDEALNDSISATKNKINLIIERQELKSGRVRNFIIGIASITLALMTIIIGFNQDKNNLDPSMVCLGNSIANNFTLWMLYISIILSVYYINHKMECINNSRVIRDLYRIGNFFKKSRHVSSNILLFILFLSATIILSLYVDGKFSIEGAIGWFSNFTAPVTHLFNSCVRN